MLMRITACTLFAAYAAVSISQYVDSVPTNGNKEQHIKIYA